MPRTRNPNGMGSIKLRSDGRYQWRQVIDGKERYLYANSPKELREKIKKVTDLPITNTKLKAAEWFDKWLEVYILPLKKSATYNQYRIIYQTHIKPIIGSRKLNSLKPVDIQGVIAKMNEKGLSTWTMKHARKIMSIAFAKAVEEKLIPLSPVTKIEIPTKQAKPRKTLTVEELSKLFKAMAKSRWLWSVKFALVTGLRRGELLALRWSDIDYQNKRLTVDESNSTSGLGDTKSAKVHYVPLSDKAIEYLNGQKSMLEAEFNPALFNEEKMKADLVFPNKRGEMVRPDSYYTCISRYAAKAGIHASPHMLRHTFVYLSRSKLTRKEIQDALGHEESTTTDDIYGLILNDSTIKTAAKIDDAFNLLDEEMERIEREKAEKAQGKMGKVLEFKRKDK
jgi:integrase